MGVTQPRGSMDLRASRALRIATCVAMGVAGCAHGNSEGPPPGDDASVTPDASHHDPDAAQLLPDSAGCTISAGVTPAIDGVGDLADYPSAQAVTLYAPLAAGDGAAIAWDASNLYVTVASSAFASAFEPLHVYVEAGSALVAAVPGQGKEYSNLVPQLPFTPTHLIAARRVSDAGTGSYDAVFVPASAWTTQEMPLATSVNVFVSTDQRQLSMKVPWSAFGGCPTQLRLAMHVVHAVAGNEWKDIAPATSTPWQAPGGGYYEIDLTGSTAVASWTLH